MIREINVEALLLSMTLVVLDLVMDRDSEEQRIKKGIEG